MAGLYSRLKVWLADETLTSEELDAEFKNVQDNFIASKVEGDSTVNNVPNNERMDAMQDPFPSGQRVYASSVADEIEELRFMIASITGNDEWYDAPATTILQMYEALQAQGSINPNSVLSGPENSQNGAVALFPSGSTNTATMTLSSGSPLKVVIAGTDYTFTTSQTLSGLSLAPSINNTGTISTGLGSAVGLLAGENGTKIIIGSTGSNITAALGTTAGFKVVHSGSTEYFTAYVEAVSGSQCTLSRARRGYFNDHSGVGIPRLPVADGDVVTLCRIGTVFITSSGSLDVTYNPIYTNSIAPSSPSAGDYWFDSANGIWKKYGGGGFVASNATILGSVISDSTLTGGARTFEYFASYSALNSVWGEVSNSGQTISSEVAGQKVSVAGKVIDFKSSRAIWNLTGPFAPGEGYVTGALYYAYMTFGGEQILSSVAPYDRQEGLQGYYHPYFKWRAVGFVQQSPDNNRFIGFNSFGEPTRIPSNPAGQIPNPATGNSYGTFVGTNVTAGLGQLASSPVVSANSPPSTITSISGLGCTLKTGGNPVLVTLQPAATFQGYMSFGSGTIVAYQIIRTNDIGEAGVVVYSTKVGGQSSGSIFFLTPAIHFFDFPSSGDQTYQVQWSCSSLSTSQAIANLVLTAKEMR